MAIKATCVDEVKNVHLVIGLNRENEASLLRGKVLTLPRSSVTLGEDSDIAIIFAETDQELMEQRMPRPLPVASTRPQ